ncbi:endolytic transglycosylase MltG [Domibacillus sp. A3M-37]|uniref:endolytic transglycosylase MltG n=1 Tax=Domibacillus sp. A3M-37 TaxID=2962037 RepID=UPI0020B72C4F|nr:endolytic transglycosylase MltG [Domibacillus sp. A3M-37]MCP3762648.1 endolytic transglycosylase MltG [Domibacillus sp. A3M-37]
MSNNVFPPASGRKRRLKRAILIVFFLFLLLAAAGAAGAYYIWQSASEPADAGSKEEVGISIPLGSSLSFISQTLEDNGIVKNATLFKYYVKYKGEGDFQAGEYVLSPSMTPDAIMASLKEGKVIGSLDGAIAIPEGYQLTQIAEIIASETDRTAEEVLAVLNDKAFVEKMMADHPALVTKAVLGENIRYPLEGYLYPATYDVVDTQKPVEEIAEEMIAKTDEIVQRYSEQIKASGMTVHEFLTFSSLVEEEATGKTDRKKIASVFYNRMKVNMPLQTDPTVLYAHGEHKDRVLYADLKVDSPYNTYQVKGLTPGPIGNSGIDSMEAVLAPERTEFLYFLASPAGDVYYSKTLDEHNKLKAKYITNNQ